MTAKLDLNHIIHWFNAVRESSNKDRALESFWNTQLKSKNWLITELNNIPLGNKPLSIVIHGGWNGVLASMLFQLLDYPIEKIVSIDIDPNTEETAHRLNYIESKEDRFFTVVDNMVLYQYNTTPDIVINTSCEHITEEDYSKWFEKIPTSSLIVCQSNNNFSLDEHINCSKNMGEFIVNSKIDSVLYSGCYPCSGYTRFMVIGKKHLA